MREFQLIFKNRDINQDREVVVTTPLSVDGYSWTVEGGPDDASLSGFAINDSVKDLLQLLRCPIEIWDVEFGIPVWWGYVNSVQIPIDAGNPSSQLSVAVSLDHMANRLSVLYSFVPAGSSTIQETRQTDWLDFTAGEVEFGIKELLISMSEASDEQAQALRDVSMQKTQYPISEVIRDNSGQVKIGCLGWIHSLDWTYYRAEVGLETNEGNTGTQNLGETVDCLGFDQIVFCHATRPWSASSVEIGVSIVNNSDPETAFTDELYVRLYSDAGGAIGSLLATAVYDPANLSETNAWVKADFDTVVTMSPSEAYHLVVTRTGTEDSDHYYVIAIDEGLSYADGNLQINNDGSWEARDPDADLTFKVEGVQRINDQLFYIFEDEGQFVPSITNSFLSSVFSNPYRDGTTTALTEILKIIRTGNGDDKIYTILVGYATRRAFMDEQADDDEENTVRMAIDGTLWVGESQLPPSVIPVGKWRKFKDIDLGELGEVAMTNVEKAYIYSGSYEAQSDSVDLVTWGAKLPWELTFTTQG